MTGKTNLRKGFIQNNPSTLLQHGKTLKNLFAPLNKISTYMYLEIDLLVFFIASPLMKPFSLVWIVTQHRSAKTFPFSSSTHALFSQEA